MQLPLTFDLQYGIPFYLQYLAHWPEYFIVAEAPGGELMGYSKFCFSQDIKQQIVLLFHLFLWII